MSTGAPQHQAVSASEPPPPGLAHAESPRSRPRWVAITLAALLLAGWTSWTVDAYRMQLRGVSAAELRADLASGSVQDYFLVSDLSDSGRGGLAWARAGLGRTISGTVGLTEGGLPEAGRGVVAVAYHVDSWERPTRLVMLPLLDDRGAAIHDPALVVQQFRAAGVRAQGELGAPPVDLPSWNIAEAAGLGASVLMVGALLASRPRRATGWFWFWTLWLPFGLGVVAFALAELAFPRDQPAERRGRGWLSFLVVLLLGGFATP